MVMPSDISTVGRVGSRAVLLASRLVAWGAWVLMLALVVGSVLVWLMGGQKALPISFARGTLGVVAIAMCAGVFTTVGTILAAKLPRNPIGWSLLVIGMLFAFLTPVDLLIQAAFEVARPFPSSTLFAAWLMSSAMTPIIAGSILTVCLVFPDGQLPRGHWRAGGVLAIAGSILLAISSALDPAGLIWYPAVPNPAALPTAYGPLVSSLRMAALAALLCAGLVAAACVAVRYRRADDPVRRQLRWIVVGVGVMTAGLLPFLVARYALQLGDVTGEMLIAVAAAACCMFPISVVLAVVRQHLFDLDQVISKTLVYVPLMGILAGVYTASLTLFQRIFMSIANDKSDAAIVLSALVLASVFAPVRSALETQVNRHFKSVHSPNGDPVADGARRIAPSLGEPIAASANGVTPGTTTSRDEVVPVARPTKEPAAIPRSTGALSAAPRSAVGELDLAARVSEIEAALETLKGIEERRGGPKAGTSDATADAV